MAPLRAGWLAGQWMGGMDLHTLAITAIAHSLTCHYAIRRTAFLDFLNDYHTVYTIEVAVVQIVWLWGSGFTEVSTTKTEARPPRCHSTHNTVTESVLLQLYLVQRQRSDSEL
eukprot:2297694-Prymnesium_polylepis.1